MTTKDSNPKDKDGDGSQAALNTLLVEHLSKNIAQHERDLRWKNIRFFILSGIALLFTAIYAVAGYFAFSPYQEKAAGDYASLIRIEGVIDAGNKAAADKLNPAFAKAFADKKAKGVVLLINSPGGSPVQAALMYERIRELRKEHPNLKIVAVAEDMLTSGGYFIAAAADEIYVNRSTVAGSIGVISSQFGFPKLLDRVGVERRVFTAGINKNRFDQFLPMKEQDKKKMDSLLDKIHEHFKDAVLEARKGRLKASPDVLFTGDFWTGEDAVKYGLADGLGSLPSVLKKEFGVEYTQDYTPAPSLFDRFGGILAKSIQDFLVSESYSLRLQ